MSDRFVPHAFAILRIVAGVMFAIHGSQKLLGWPPGGPPQLPPLLRLGGVIELAGGLLIAIGLFTRVAAFFGAGEMAVAYFMVHAPHGFLPLQNKGELAVVYCFLWLFVAVHGAGAWSVDSALAARRRGTPATLGSAT